MREKRLRVTLARRDVCNLLDALENIIEDYKYDGGLSWAEDYIELRERLHVFLRDLDLEGKRAA